MKKQGQQGVQRTPTMDSQIDLLDAIGDTPVAVPSPKPFIQPSLTDSAKKKKTDSKVTPRQGTLNFFLKKKDSEASASKPPSESPS